MPETVIDDVRTLDPVSYIRQLRLRPEDSYGFVPMRLGEGSALLYLYGDRPEYKAVRPKLAPPAEAEQFGPIRIEPTQTVQTPDPEKLARIAKLRASGAIDDPEYAKLRAEAGAPDSAAAAPDPAETTRSNGAAAIIAHRIYPGMRMRSSTRQLNRFLPLYQEAVGVHPEDVYGVFPWGTRTSQSGTDSSSTEWDDYWIVYRDRPEYAAGREAYATEMDKKGRWPQPVVTPGIGEAPAAAPTGGKLNVEKDRWPRKALVIKQTETELADSLREKISKWGFEPEDSYGFCPNFPHSSIYFGWRKA